MIRIIILAIALFFSFSIVGCNSNSKSDANGLSINANRVGQGKGFVFVAPTEGRIYRVRAGKVDGMRILSKGETYHALGPVEGDDPTKDFDDFEYYFESTQQKDLKVPQYR